MTALDRDILAEKVQAVERHLGRVVSRLPDDPSGLTPASDVLRSQACCTASRAYTASFLARSRATVDGDRTSQIQSGAALK